MKALTFTLAVLAASFAFSAHEVKLPASYSAADIATWDRARLEQHFLKYQDYYCKSSESCRGMIEVCEKYEKKTTEAQAKIKSLEKELKEMTDAAIIFQELLFKVAYRNKDRLKDCSQHLREEYNKWIKAQKPAKKSL